MGEYDYGMELQESADYAAELGMLEGDAREDFGDYGDDRLFDPYADVEVDGMDLLRQAEEDCPMDGDAESALASCGWGTDEDYGCFEADPYEY